MTSPHTDSPYAASPYVTLPTAPAAPRSHPVLRALFGCFMVVAGIAGALMAALAAAVTWTGCFIGCSGENHAGGAAWAAVSVVLLVSGPAAVSGLYRSARWMWGAGAIAVAGVLFWLIVLASA